MTLLDELANYLVAATTLTVGGTTGTLTKAIMRDSQPDTVASLFETGGLPSMQAFSTGGNTEVVYERPSVQLLSRSTSYETARGVAQNVYLQLDGLKTVEMTGTRWLSVDAIQPPFSIGRDKNERYLVSVNFQARKQVSLDSFDEQAFDGGFN